MGWVTFVPILYNKEEIEMQADTKKRKRFINRGKDLLTWLFCRCKQFG
jgi:hypothetical protein